ncbi:MAG: low molecular weight phosphotyrosine protein phosphatase [Chromatocurvus sp.]
MIIGRPTHRVLFLCTANVCRSPLAEALLRRRLRERGLHRQVAVASAGTRVGQPGRRPDPRVVQLCAAAGVSLRGVRARAVKQSALERSDSILVMEPQHLDDLAAQGVPQQVLERVQLLGRYLPPGYPAPKDSAIPDPYFADREGFLSVYQQIDAAVLQWVAVLLQPTFDSTSDAEGT